MSSVLNQCTASSFEEAHRVNSLRLANERDGAVELAEQLKAEGKPIDGVDPEFWRGCEAANDLAFSIYKEELAALKNRIAARLAAEGLPTARGTAYGKWFESVKVTWTDAMKKNDPGTVVWW